MFFSRVFYVCFLYLFQALITAVLALASVSAAPRGGFLSYRDRLAKQLHSDGVVQGSGYGSFPHGGGGGGGFSSGSDEVLGYISQCVGDEVRNTDGTCGIPEVNRKIYVFAAQQSYEPPPPPVRSGDPEVNIDVILVKTPGPQKDEIPIVVPPSEQKTVVYVLSKRPTHDQEVIQVPSTPEEPEVYFVNYAEGENPSLPGGIDLQSALQQASTLEGGSLEGGYNQRPLSYNNFV